MDIIKTLVFFISILCPAVSNADNKNTHYFLLKTGVMAVDADNSDPVIAVGMIYGNQILPYLNMEVESNLSTSGGKFVDSNGEGEYEVTTVSVNAVHHNLFSDYLYLKTKGGVIWSDVTRKANINRSSSGYGISAGIGLGVSFDLGNIETEITYLEKDITYYSISISLHLF